MKKILMVVLCLISIIGLTGCSSKTNIKTGSESNANVVKDENIISIKDGTLKSTGVTIILNNDSDNMLRYTEEYEIEVYNENKWYKIDNSLAFNEPLWELESNKSREIELNWKDGYGSLEKGKYRILKNIYFENEPDEKKIISVEFEIK